MIKSDFDWTTVELSSTIPESIDQINLINLRLIIVLRAEIADLSNI